MLFRYFKKFNRYGVLAVLCIALETAFELAIPLLMADIIDFGINQGQTAVIYRQGMFMVGCALVALILGYLYAHFASRFAFHVGHQLRVDGFQRIQDFSFKNIDNFSSASLITRLTSDINIIQSSMMNGIRPLCRAPVMLIMSIVFSFMMDRRLFLVFFVSVPVLASLLVLIVRTIEPRFKLLQEAVDRVNGIVQENLSGIRVVKAYVREDYEALKFELVNRNVMETGVKTYRIATLNLPLFQTVMYGTILALLWFGGNLIFVGGMKIGALTGILSYVLQVLNSLMMLSNVFLLATRAMTSVVRIEEILKEEIDIKDNEDGLTVLEDGSIVFRHVSFKYNEHSKEPVINDVSFAISSGTMVGFMGTTGSSKSSLVQLILRLYDVNAGEVIVGGENVKRYNLHALRQQIAIVLQKNTLFSGTVLENLKWGNEDASLEEVKEACRIACCDEFIEDYDARVERGGVNFSGGQRQRLCIARALIKKPKILILDDSTSALDRQTERRIWDALKQSYPDMTKIIIAQRVSSLRDTDQIIILDGGEVHAAGDHEALLILDPLYREVFESQKEGVLAQ